MENKDSFSRIDF